MKDTTLMRCKKCRNRVEIPAKATDIIDWQHNRQQRPLIQNAFPDLSTDERELILSGICGECWERIFGGHDDEN